MSGPVEELIDDSGAPGAAPRLAAAVDIANAWVKQTAIIPPQFAEAVAFHETSYKLNERDTEATGKVTCGIFQLTQGIPSTPTDSFYDDDRVLAGFPDYSFYDLDQACRIFAVICERRLKRIQVAVDKFNAAHGLAPVDWTQPPLDTWSLLAVAHNAGTGVALKWIADVGLDWASCKRNHPTWNICQVRANGCYGDDAQTGTANYQPPTIDTADPSGAGSLAIDATTESRLRIGGVLLLVVLLVATLWPGLVARAGKALL